MRPLILSAALTVLALGAVAGGAALAASPPAKPAAATAVKPGQKWVVDKANSKIALGTAYSGKTMLGQFNAWTADIAFDPKNLAGSHATVSVDMTSAFFNDEDTDDALPSADWFNADKFKTATFATQSIKDLGGGKYQAAGTLTIKGVTKPCTLNFTVAITGDVAKMNGTATVNRNDFGVGQGQFKGSDTVPYPVAINVSVTAKKG